MVDLINKKREGKSLENPFLSKEEIKEITEESDLALERGLSEEKTFCNVNYNQDEPNAKDLKRALEGSLKGFNFFSEIIRMNHLLFIILF